MDVNIKKILDKRVRYKGDKYNLSIRINKNSEVVYLPIRKITEKQYEAVFVKNLIREDANKLREDVNEILSKCENICAGMGEFTAKRFKKLYYEEPINSSNENNNEYPKSLTLKNLFEYYIKNKDLKTNTRKHFKTSMNVFEKYDEGVTVYEITPKYLSKFETDKLKSRTCNIQGLGSYLRDLRRIINYFIFELKIIPKDYEYPFGKGKYSIKDSRDKKPILSAEEIISVAEFEDFENEFQRYVRDIWLTLFYMNGINFVDLLKMKWENIKGDHITIQRKKTETRQKKVVQLVNIPLTDELKDLINIVGDPTSPFVLGKMNSEEYSDQTITNRKNKLRQLINPELRKISEKLKLSVPLTMETARRCYAQSLKRNGFKMEEIAEQLGHSDIVSTAHYVDSLGLDKLNDMNNALPKKRKKTDKEITVYYGDYI